MKTCLACHHTFNDSAWSCPSCQHQPNHVDGFLAFAPELARASDGFREETFDELAQLEARHFWFKSRNQLIAWALRKYFSKCQKLLEVGCGTGYVLSGIAKSFPNMSLAGSEIFANGLHYAAKRLPDVSLFQMDARAIPYQGEFDVIGAFDVLEHIEQDLEVLGQMHQALKPNGGIMLTVPQHQFLWSQADEYACHVRRYSQKEMKRKLEQAGFKITRMTSFVSLLMPLMMLSRKKMQHQKDYSLLDELKISNAPNSLFNLTQTFERQLIKLGLNLPMGGSLLVLAHK